MSEEANVVYVKAKSINDVTRLNVQSINEVNEVVSSNNKMHIYEQQALQHVNTAKHYADIALNSSQESLSNSNKAEIWAEGTDEEVQALGGEHSSKRWAEILAEGTGSKWGSIIGNITEQYDLMEQLDSKANTSYVEELITGFEEALEDKVDNNVFESAVGSFSEAIENVEGKINGKQDLLFAGSNITISNNVISAETSINDKITNCLLKASGEVSISGNMVSTQTGIKALIPNGRNADGTLKNIEWESQTGILSEVPFYGDATHLVYMVEHYNLLHSRFLGSFLEAPTVSGANGTYYNITENKMYMNGGTSWYEANFVFLAELMVDSNNNITHLKSKKPIRLVDYNDFERLDTLPHIVQTYHNGNSWYRLYSDGWCEQGGYNNGRNNWGSIELLVPFSNTDYSVFIGRFILGEDIDNASLSYQVTNVTTTGFKVRQTYSTSTGNGLGSGASYAYKWEAKGKIR